MEPLRFVIRGSFAVALNHGQQELLVVVALFGEALTQEMDIRFRAVAGGNLPEGFCEGTFALVKEP
ncbi:hypothetical protein StoSoilB20_41680 [Arthrobacter sp. StoSoilB20]|nr:hypothetical protein StoSoilB20_41680 [Arthrobacter sp. StoSoilB20]